MYTHKARLLFMSLKKQKRRNKKPILILVLVVGLVLAYGVVAYTKGLFPFQGRNISTGSGTSTTNTVNYDEASDTQKNAGQSAKEQFLNKETEATKERAQANGETESTPTSQQNTETVITSTSLQSGTLSIRVMMITLDQNGKCSITATRNGSSPINQTVGTQTMGSYTVCSGFDLEGASSGNWKIDVNYKGSAGQVGSASKEAYL